MASLVLVQGPKAGPFTLDAPESLIGRRPDSAVFLESLAVSREHARILREADDFFVEDIGSSNGTFVNGRRISERTPLRDRDALQIGPYVFTLKPEPSLRQTESELVIRSQVPAQTSNRTLYAQNPAHKLQVVLEIAQDLGHGLDTSTLLARLVDQLLRLFPLADRGMVLLGDADRLTVKAQKARGAVATPDFSYSRTIVKTALEEGVGILSEDAGADRRFSASATLVNLNLRSLLCVPLIGQDKKRLGVIQLDCSRPNVAFTPDDLDLLTTVSLQVSVVLENAQLHAERLREERLRQELAMAREIQAGFLPTNFAPTGLSGFELYAEVHPARDVSGDLYDFFPTADGKLLFLLGDVSGKGMPAAMFMVKVHTLSRHLAAEAPEPVRTLTRLNEALAAHNQTGLFVTMTLGVYDPRTGEVVMASGAHPLPLLRHPDGTAEEVPVPTGLPLGCLPIDPNVTEYRLQIKPGETLVFYTDGFTEAAVRGADGKKRMFGPERLRDVVGGPRTRMSLKECAEETRRAIERYTGNAEQQDDLTLLLLRRQ